MRLVIQRVSRARVTVDGETTGGIQSGFLILLGVAKQDTEADAAWLAGKAAGLRVFPDDNGKMNRSLVEAGGAALVVSQFTLYGDVRKGRRPAFDRAAEPEKARALYEHFIKALRAEGVTVATGKFKAMMEVELVNTGPVTILIDSEKTF
jgi:D-tyrosyl-tRNA(Tyr) deacylase